MTKTKPLTAPTTEVAAEWVPTGSLVPWAKNPRKNDGKPVAKVVESIKRFGFGAPILARRENSEIIAGHTRWKAAQKLGLDRVPVRFLDLNEAEAHILAIADNRLNEEAPWDDQLVSEFLLAASVEDRALTGFEVYEVSKYVREAIDANAEWVGMPECESEDQTAKFSVKINFASEADMLAFSEFVGQTITTSTKSIWYPEAEIGHYADRAYENDTEAESAL